MIMMLMLEASTTPVHVQPIGGDLMYSDGQLLRL